MSFRIGQGYDVHAFGAASKKHDADIVLGGVRIPHTKALLAHSDGDVLLHAICDALLGALALGDIGKHFPDSDPTFADADSRQLLRHCFALVQEHGYAIANIDTTIIAQSPKMAPHIDAMQKNIATDLQLPDNVVSVKATTTERLGFCGREEGIACMAIVLLQREPG